MHIPGHLPGKLRQLIMRWENRLFATEDAAARAQGWQVSRPSNGFGRTYRDPRWDLISACELCDGDGGTALKPCRPCAGIGTIRPSTTGNSTTQPNKIHASLGGVS